jgi:hypothetical protein
VASLKLPDMRAILAPNRRVRRGLTPALGDIGEIFLSEWDLSKWLESLAYLAAILGSLSACIVFLLRHRRTSIEVIRSTIGRAWTNEGDISSTESILITLDLKDYDGDIIGQISSSAHDKLL